MDKFVLKSMPHVKPQANYEEAGLTKKKKKHIRTYPPKLSLSLLIIPLESVHNHFSKAYSMKK